MVLLPLPPGEGPEISPGRYLEAQGEATGPHPPHMRTQQVVGEQLHLDETRSRKDGTGRRADSPGVISGAAPLYPIGQLGGAEPANLLELPVLAGAEVGWDQTLLPEAFWQEIATAQAQWFRLRQSSNCYKSCTTQICKTAAMQGPSWKAK